MKKWNSTNILSLSTKEVGNFLKSGGSEGLSKMIEKSKRDQKTTTKSLDKYIYYLKKRINRLKNGRLDWFAKFLLRKLLSFHNWDGVKIMEKDWDALMILDACRYDVFESIVSYLPFEGTLKKKQSVATNTPHFLERNFHLADTFYDTIYITANPWASKNPYYRPETKFYKVYHVWKTHWNDKYETCLAGDVTKVAVKVRKEYPNKSLIIHYMQPHQPFIGETKLYGDSPEDKKFKRKTLWYSSKVKEAWKDNLIYALKQVAPYIEQFNEKTIITADHGDSFRFHGHPPELPVKELLEVPWYIINKRNVKSNISRKINSLKPEILGDENESF